MNNKILHHLTMPDKSAECHAARDKLLTKEIALRRQIEGAATLRRRTKLVMKKRDAFPMQ